MKLQKRILVLLFALMLTATIAACSTASGDDLQNPDYYTDFDDLDDWDLYAGFEEEDYELQATFSGLSISLNNPSDILYGYLAPEYADVSIGSFVEYVEGEADITFELVCRSNEIGEYIFAFDYMGYYYVWYYDKETEEYSEFDSGDTFAINTDDSGNEINADCIGTTLNYYINGVHVASVEDDTLSSGLVGFGVQTYDENTAKVLFGYFELFEE